jgi:hypothetical protein
VNNNTILWDKPYNSRGNEDLFRVQKFQLGKKQVFITERIVRLVQKDGIVIHKDWLNLEVNVMQDISVIWELSRVPRMMVQLENCVQEVDIVLKVNMNQKVAQKEHTLMLQVHKINSIVPVATLDITVKMREDQPQVVHVTVDTFVKRDRLVQNLNL